ncbi:HNH endonuclease [Streptomyces platensis]|uniref:HNH endonuclease n=1 Tax=Streptomyces platensis TaxID=58346 RepID=UPI0037A7F5DF
MTAWLALWTEGERARSGEIYDDALGRYYSWDSKVVHHATVTAGDAIVMWNSKTLLGISALSAIHSEPGTKEVHRCPKCNDTEVNPRKTLTPLYRCAQCKHEFDEPVRETVQVQKYRGTYEAGWVDLEGALSGKELRELCEHPNAQNSFRRLKWDELQAKLDERGVRTPLRIVKTTMEAIAGGHRQTTTRARVGQANFRKQLLDAYGENCAFTGPTPAAVLEAAHLYSYAASGEHHGDGGLLLRRDVHRLFDLGLMAVDPQTLRIDVDDSVSDHPYYQSLHGQPLTVGNLLPKQRKWLEDHWSMHRTP